MDKSVYWFSELSKESISIAGGKGANLAEMTNSGFPVPPGFMVSAGAYHEFINHNNLQALIKLKTDNLDVEDSEALQQASDGIKKGILLGEIPQEIRSDIVKAYNKLCGTDSLIPSLQDEVLVAIRSSATLEDLGSNSFAGQQATFLNIQGSEEVVKAVRECWASLFEARAIYYRDENKFEHLKVGIAVVVQKMAQSEKSGIMFSADPVTSDTSKLVIEAGFGLGEAIVSGMVTPDRYVIEKSSVQIISKQINRQESMIVKQGARDETVEVPEELKEKQKLSEEEILALAKLGIAVEQHYNFPQDMEWAIEGRKIFLVQSRPITTLKKKEEKEEISEEEKQDEVQAGPKPEHLFQQAHDVAEESEAESGEHSMHEEEEFAHVASKASFDNARILTQGLAASPGIAVGVVKLIHDKKELYKVNKGDVLVTEMTNPDYVPAMKRAIAIVTNQGGTTAHAAIVSRELGIPCIVGTSNATKVLSDGMTITVDATRGVVYEGAMEVQEEKSEKEEHADNVAQKVIQNIPLVTGTKIYVNVAEVELAEGVAQQNVDGVGLLRAEFMIAGIGVHPKKLIKENRQSEFVDTMAKGLRKVCAAFYPRPVIYRATDFKTNEYKNLEGGEEFEPHEENPMIGYRGCFRYVKEPEVFKLELQAIKKVREQYGMKNLWLMIPVVRRVHDLRVCKKIIEEEGLFRSYDFKLGIMCEVPSNVILADEFCAEGIDFMSIGSNDLTQLTLGVDRDNNMVAEDFDERDPAVLKSIEHVITACHKRSVKIGICGQAPSVYPEFAEKLVEYGIDSISVNPDVIDVTRRIVASAEKRVLLQSTRKG